MDEKVYIFLEKSNSKTKRFAMKFLFYDEEKEKLKQVKKTSFGAKGYSKFIIHKIHKDEERKNNYLKRH